MEDHEIIELYWRRDEEAIRASQARYGRYCLHIAGAILADRQDAEECVSDTWLRAWNAMPPHRPVCLRLCLGRITRALACDQVRAQHTRKRGGGTYEEALEELAECLPAAQGTEQAAQARELERAVNAFLHTLPEQACNVFLRRYWYAESLEDIAGRYGMKTGTVKTSLFRTRRKLKDYLEKEELIP